MPWYTTPQALTIIAGLKQSPPARVFERDTNSRNYHDGQNSYQSSGALRLRKMFARAFVALDTIRPWPQAEATALMRTSADEVLAALFGDPNNLDWAHPDRAAFRVALAAEIDEALAREVAA